MGKGGLSIHKRIDLDTRSSPYTFNKNLMRTFVLCFIDFIHSCLLKHVAWWKVNFYTIRAHICDIHIISWGPALHDGCKEAEVCCSIISKDTCLNIHEDAKQAAGPRLTAGLLVIIILWLSNISILLLLMDCKHFNYSILINDTV